MNVKNYNKKMSAARAANVALMFVVVSMWVSVDLNGRVWGIPELASKTIFFLLLLCGIPLSFLLLLIDTRYRILALLSLLAYVGLVVSGIMYR